MKLFIKSVSTLMVLVMSLTVFLYGCKKDPTNPEETTKTQVSQTDSLTTQKPLVPEEFGAQGSPAEYLMLVRANRYSYLFGDEVSSDRVKQSTYERNIYIEDMFNIKFTISEGNNGAEFENKLMSNDSSFSLAVPDYWWGLERKGLFTNLYDIDDLDFEDSYWYNGWNKETTVYNKTFSIVGDGTLELLENLEIIFFNKQMLENIGGNVYSLYNDGNWTIEEMQKLIVQAGQNLDDEDTTNDIYGALYDIHSLCAQTISNGLRVTERTKNGDIELRMKSENNIYIVDILKAFIHNNTAVLYTNKTNRDTANPNITYFSNGSSLFYAAALERGQVLKEASTEFKIGIVPMPKLDSNQRDYYSTSYGLSYFSIPKAATDEHMSAVILNAMNYLSNETIVKTFYDIVMKGQFSDTEQDAKMIDSARENMYFDFAFINESAVDAPLNIYRDSIRDNESVSLNIDLKLASIELKLQELLTLYSDLE